MKITFEFDDQNENYDDIKPKILIHKPEIMSALYDLSDLNRIIWNRKFYEETEYKVINDKEYVNIDWVENEINKIYEKIKFLLDD